jgi:uncharacterized membrane protein (GlpM family)
MLRKRNFWFTLSLLAIEGRYHYICKWEFLTEKINKSFKKALEDTEGPIKNEQSRETGNIGYTRRRKTKQKHNTISGLSPAFPNTFIVVARQQHAEYVIYTNNENTDGAGTAHPSGAHEFTPSCSICSFLCSVLYIIVFPFVIFLEALYFLFFDLWLLITLLVSLNYRIQICKTYPKYRFNNM